MARHNKIWTTKFITETLKKMEAGAAADTSCFWNQDTGFRAADINFQMTQEETEEFVKCSDDVIYFSNKYCFAMTDEGIANIELRPYQENMLRSFQQNRFVVMMASRQIGKCHLFNTKIKILNKTTGETQEIPVYEFRHLIIKDQIKALPFKQRLIYKLKYQLYKLYDKLDN